MKYIKKVLSEESVQSLIKENQDILSLVTKEKLDNLISEVSNYVKLNLKDFTESDINETYLNIKEFSKFIIEDYLYNISEIISNEYNSKELKSRLIEEEINWRGYAQKAGECVGAACSATWNMAKQDYSDLRNPSNQPGFLPKQFQPVEHVSKYAIKYGILGTAFMYVLNSDIFGSKKIQDMKIPTEGDKKYFTWFGLRPDETKFDVQSKSLDEFEKTVSSIQKDVSKRVDVDTTDARNHFDLLAIKAQLEKSREQLNSTQELDPTLEDNRGLISSKIDFLIEQIKAYSVKVEADKDIGPVSKFFEDIGTVPIYLLLPGLLFLGYIKYKDFVKLKLLERKFDNYIDTISRLGYPEIHDIQLKAENKKTQCSDKISREIGTLKIKDKVYCFTEYLSTIIVGGMMILLQQCKKSGVDMSKIKNIEDLLSREANKDMFLADTVRDSFSDLRVFVDTVYNNPTITAKVIKSIEDIMSPNFRSNNQPQQNNPSFPPQQQKQNFNKFHK